MVFDPCEDPARKKKSRHTADTTDTAGWDVYLHEYFRKMIFGAVFCTLSHHFRSGLGGSSGFSYSGPWTTKKGIREKSVFLGLGVAGIWRRCWAMPHRGDILHGPWILHSDCFKSTLGGYSF